MAKQNKLAKALGTTNEDEQVQVIQRLMAPVFTLVIHVDGRAGQPQVDILSADAVPFQSVYATLDYARRAIAEQERQRILQSTKQDK